MKIPDYISNDSYLLPYSDFILNLLQKREQALQLFINEKTNIYSAVNNHLYYGEHIFEDILIFREWAPNARAIWLISEVTHWKKHYDFKFTYLSNGNWELKVHANHLPKGTKYKLVMEWEGGEGERIPAWSKSVVQDESTKIFNALVVHPENQYKWKHKTPVKPAFPLIYEAHIGMSSEEEKVSSFNEFRVSVLPRIVKAGYNTLQLMAIQEHPFYGSFGYHVSGFFAVSSRFGTPDDLKVLIDTAHGYGLYVIMDLVHSHAVKNEIEGISKYDGTEYQFFHKGAKGQHLAWDSRCFDYGKPEVLHFLLSNCKFWLEEYRFDGFRFDGITSMLYTDHGLERNFLSYSDYFTDNLDTDAFIYLSFANKLIHEIRPDIMTIAEDMSGFPGLAVPYQEGGCGFDYRLAMGVPDYWIKLCKEVPDEQWHVGEMFYRLTDKRNEEKVISYAESHDQALVGDKTLIFRLLDSEMYYNMSLSSTNLLIDRGIALHKMIRLLTLATAGGGYLNFMGNEFGHPEWIDFPREENGWSYFYARRQWHLAEDETLKYKFLLEFDREMILLAKTMDLLLYSPEKIYEHNESQILVFRRNRCLFAFNFNPLLSFSDYKIYGITGSYKYLLSSDDPKFGGFDRIDKTKEYHSLPEGQTSCLQLYLPARTVLVLIEIELDMVILNGNI